MNSRKIVTKTQHRQQNIVVEHVDEIDGNTVHSRLYQNSQRGSPRQRAQMAKTGNIGQVHMFSENLSMEDQPEVNKNQASPQNKAESNTFRPSISEQSRKILERKKQKETEEQEGQ